MSVCILERSTMKRRFLAFFLFAMLTIFNSVLLAACNYIQPSTTMVSYAPEVYGQNGYCYYVNDVAEAIALQQAGLCPNNWQPMIMPVVWHSMYAEYYDSPSYYGYYVPSSRRVYYQKTVVVQFEKTHQADITKYSNSGKWKGSDGKEYNGKTVTTQVKQKKAEFTSGSAKQAAQSKTTSSTTKPKTTSSSSTKTKSSSVQKSTTKSKTTTQAKPSTSKPSSFTSSKPKPSTSSRSITTTKSTGGFRGGRK